MSTNARAGRAGEHERGPMRASQYAQGNKGQPRHLAECDSTQPLLPTHFLTPREMHGERVEGTSDGKPGGGNRYIRWYSGKEGTWESLSIYGCGYRV